MADVPSVPCVLGVSGVPDLPGVLVPGAGGDGAGRAGCADVYWDHVCLGPTTGNITCVPQNGWISCKPIGVLMLGFPHS